MSAHCKNLLEEGGCFTKTDFYPLCSLPPSPNPATPWTLKTGGLNGDGGDVLSSCQGSKVGAVEWQAQIAVGCAEAALLSVWGECSAYLLAFSVYKGKLQVIILNGFVCPVGG